MARTKGAVIKHTQPGVGQQTSRRGHAVAHLAPRAHVFSNGLSSPCLGKSLKIAITTASNAKFLGTC